MKAIYLRPFPLESILIWIFFLDFDKIQVHVLILYGKLYFIASSQNQLYVVIDN